MKNRFLVVLMSAGLLMAALPVGTALAAPGDNNGKKAENVWICHFDGHEHGFWANIEGEALDGDYVERTTALVNGQPGPESVWYCETYLGGTLIEVNANALGGHRAQLLPRVEFYPV